MSALAVLQAERGNDALPLSELARLRAGLPGVRLVLVRERIPFWRWDVRALAALVDRVFLADPSDPRAVRRALDGVPLDGAVTFNEECLRSVGALVAARGLAGPRAASVELARDKARLREALAARGVAVPAWRCAASAAAARDAARALGFPLVLKPRDAAAGVGVSLATSLAELDRAFRIAAGARWGDGRGAGVLVERFAGRTIAANLYVAGGRAGWLCASLKRTRAAPFFLTEEDRMAPGAIDEARVREVCERAIGALSLDACVVHVELADDGEGLRVLEVAPRPGGGYLGAMVRARTGLDPVVVAGRLALGDDPPRAGAGHAAAVIGRYLFAPGPGRIRALRAAPARGVELHWYKSLGDRVGEPPRDYFGAVAHLVAAGADEAEADRRLERARAALSIEIGPSYDPRVAAAALSRIASAPMRRRLVARLFAPRLA